MKIRLEDKCLECNAPITWGKPLDTGNGNVGETFQIDSMDIVRRAYEGGQTYSLKENGNVFSTVCCACWSDTEFDIPDDNFIFDEKQMTFFQKDKPDGWCIVLGVNGDAFGEENAGKFTEFQVSNGKTSNRGESSDHCFLEDAIKECLKLNAQG